MSSVRLLSQLFVPLWQALRQRMAVPEINASHRPILSAQEIVDFAQSLAQTSSKVAPNLKQSEALRQGEQSSRFMGAGLEYEESRPYQLGDEIRRINWRLMARTGQAYTKLFQEERQENWFVLVDHRASMRFGTRKRLKATQAARVAGYYAWLAQQSGIPVASGRLAEGFERSPIFEGKSTYAHIMESVCKSCPPISLTGRQPEPSLNDVLLSLTQSLQPGTRLILISDFQDVNARTTEILTAMQDRLALKAVWVKDISESVIPDVEGLQLQSMTNNQVYDLNTQAQRAQYQAWSNQYQIHIQDTLQQANAALYRVWADETLVSMIQSLSQPNLDLAHLNDAPFNASESAVTTISDHETDLAQNQERVK